MALWEIVVGTYGFFMILLVVGFWRDDRAWKREVARGDAEDAEVSWLDQLWDLPAREPARGKW